MVVIDGCPLQCARHILKRHQLSPDLHYDLSKMGVPKKMHEDFDPDEAADKTEAIAERTRSLTSDQRPDQTRVHPSEEPEPHREPSDDESPEVASAPCSLREFKDW